LAVAGSELIERAAELLGVTDVGPIGAVGGQKAVRRVRTDAGDAVMKVIAVTSATSASLVRVGREVEWLKSRSNPHVVRVISELAVIGDPAVGAGWLEELLDGVDLGTRLGPRWAWSETRALIQDVASGLAEAHRSGIVHRDLSPNNVRCLLSGRFKIMDFGFARYMLEPGVTAFGQQPGTAGYLSPEHLNAFSGVPMPASDVFCLGILAYQALTGEPPIPFLGDVDEYIGRVRSVEVSQDIGNARPDLTREQHTLIRRMLHPQPARRFIDAGRLLDGLAGMA